MGTRLVVAAAQNVQHTVYTLVFVRIRPAILYMLFQQLLETANYDTLGSELGPSSLNSLPASFARGPPPPTPPPRADASNDCKGTYAGLARLVWQTKRILAYKASSTAHR